MSRRGALLDAGARVLATRPFREVRVDDIVDEAGLAHGTFYLYFEDKEQLLLALASSCRDELVPMVREFAELQEADGHGIRLEVWIRDYVAAFDSWAVVVRAWEQVHPPIPELTAIAASILDELLPHLAAHVPGLDDSDPTQLICLIGLFERFPIWATSDRFALERERIADTLQQLIERGFPRGQ